jgi:predicted nuclease of restriction endonuclease-like (RecB) superfamily
VLHCSHEILRGEFYLLSATRAHWSHRELERQIKKSAFERTMLSELKLATVSRVLPDNATGVFKDSYLADFLDLPDTHSEADLQKGLLFNLRKFLMELRQLRLSVSLSRHQLPTTPFWGTVASDMPTPKEHQPFSAGMT